MRPKRHANCAQKLSTCLEELPSWKIALPSCMKNGSLEFVLEMHESVKQIRTLMEEIRPCVVSTFRGVGLHAFVAGVDGRTAVIAEQKKTEEEETNGDESDSAFTNE